MSTSKHDEIVGIIHTLCTNMGFKTHKEYRGNGWRADIFVEKGDKKIAIEVQLSPQSPKILNERQNLYIRDGIQGCWLYLERPKTRPRFKTIQENSDLPLFYISSADPIKVSLVDKRKEVGLSDFLKAFLNDGIKFCNKVKTHDSQKVKIIFYPMECWKCGALNYLYYLDKPYFSSCNFPIEEMEAMWSGENFEFRPEILKAVMDYLKSEPGKEIHMGEIKQRFSKTVQHEYKSFGCYKCDSLFGDFFVMEEKLFARYEKAEKFFETTIYPTKIITMKLPHWCFPDDKKFCDEEN